MLNTLLIGENLCSILSSDHFLIHVMYSGQERVFIPAQKLCGRAFHGSDGVTQSLGDAYFGFSNVKSFPFPSPLLPN